MNPIELSVVVPVYNEEKVLLEFYPRLQKTLLNLALSHEILFVDDGSHDRSLKILTDLQQKNPTVKILSFSRNFGHQLAVRAGLDHCVGDNIVVMDADLQDPPEFIETLLAHRRQGYDVAYAVRAKRDGDTFFKKSTAAAYYYFLSKIATYPIPRNTGDFRLISRAVADVILRCKEHNPYIRGLVAWAGFRQIGVPFDRDARFAGETKYTFKKMLSLAISGIKHFSHLPLKLSYLSALAVMVAAILVWIVNRWTPMTMPVFLTISAIQLFLIGILGSYIRDIYDETRNRPLYIVRTKLGFKDVCR